MKQALLAFLLLVALPSFAFATQQERTPSAVGVASIERHGDFSIVNTFDGRTGTTFNALTETGGAGSTVLHSHWMSGGVEQEVTCTQGAHETVDQLITRYHTIYSRMLAEFPKDAGAVGKMFKLNAMRLAA